MVQRIENNKDTWKDAQQGCNTLGGVLEQRLMVISKTDFWFTSWSLLVWRKWKRMYVTSHWPFWARRLSSMKFFLVTDQWVIKQNGTLKWISISYSCSQLIFTEFYYHESILKYVIPKNYIKIFGVFLATYLPFSEVIFTHFITKVLRLLLTVSDERKNLLKLLWDDQRCPMTSEQINSFFRTAPN